MAATITVPHRSEVPARARARHTRPVSQRTYARRRALVGGISAAFVAVTLVASYEVLVDSSAPPAVAAVSVAKSGAVVVARPGDTLWSIAEAHRGDVAVRPYVDALIDLNGGPSIQAGQAVFLP